MNCCVLPSAYTIRMKHEIGVTNNYLSGTLTVGVEPNIVWSGV
jgi:hypothetical protein